MHKITSVILQYLVLLFGLQLALGFAHNGGCYAGTSCSKIEAFNSFLHNSPTDNVLDKVLENSSNTIHPGYKTGEPTRVTIGVYINSVDSISVDTMDYSVNIYLRQSWHDPRLQYGHLFHNVTSLNIEGEAASRLWVPDLFFPNEKSSHQHCITVPNRQLRLFPNGTVFYSSRYSLTLACHMSLEQFPLDDQTCSMRLESYGHTLDEIEFSWSEFSAVKLNPKTELPQFDLVDYKKGLCSVSYVTGDFACLEITFYLVRQFGYYMIQTYIPTLLIVSLSWVSFWISIDSVPARISLGVLTVLTLTTQSVGVWMSLPRVSYVKAIDIWMSVCVVLVFGAMLEFAIVNTLARKEIRRMSMRVRADGGDHDNHPDMLKRMIDEYMYGCPKKLDPNSRMIARRVDKWSRRLFPAVFVVFNICYWGYFLNT